MRCPKCQADIGRVTPAGEPMVRTRGLVLKAEGLTAICPKCKGGVPVEGDLRKALVLFLQRPVPRPKPAAE